MKSSAKNISLTSLDDLFSTEEERSKDVVGSIVNIPLSQLHDFPNHPFKVRDDDKMQETVESVKAYGVLVPAIVRQRPDGEYEIVAGHRRKRASELAGLSELPAIVRDLDDDAATIIMVDSNLQRENILPSERAQAYKMKLEAIKRQGARTDLTSRQLGEKSEKSYLKPEEQSLLLETIESEQATPSLSQAQRIKKLSQSGDLNEDSILGIMSEQKKPELSSNITLSGDKLKKYFPKSYTPAQIENTIFKLLDSWLRKRQREESR